MRELKFRAWDTDNQEMLDWDKVQELIFLKGIDIFHTDTLIPIEHTGLKDKNGKEGHFDDLVKWGKAIYKVVWNEGEGIAALQYVSGREIFKYLRISQIKQGVIIGNIYENPELMSS